MRWQLTANATYWEGWYAHAAGWGISEEYSEPYKRGWYARQKLMMI